MPLRLKGLSLSTDVLQSPMAACTDLAFRLVAREKGMEFAYLEMVSAHALTQKNGKTLALMKTVPADRPLGAQLVGCDPDRMGEAAAMVEDMGFDLLDLNLGCPVPKITGGGDGAGSALLNQPAKAQAIFEKVVRAVKRIPVTVKMRIGYADASGAEAADVARRAQDAGVCAVAVHGRTREQRYSGKADYAAIGRVKAAVSIPVIGNGDVASGADALRLKEESGCDAVMIGRGALGNPWIYKDVAASLAGSSGASSPPTFEERKRTLLRHLELEVEHEGERLASLHMRRVACWYFAGLPGSAAFRARACVAPTTADMRKIIEDFEPSAGAPACAAPAS
ncbi:MAG TPA: tRNA dihydrouridine synthase DusB [Elusimicrobiota bacterium]|nr:tRNA dihydrouridine synthase DusB [Elusimicrobiota bacterium]